MGGTIDVSEHRGRGARNSPSSSRRSTAPAGPQMRAPACSTAPLVDRVAERGRGRGDRPHDPGPWRHGHDRIAATIDEAQSRWAVATRCWSTPRSRQRRAEPAEAAAPGTAYRSAEAITLIAPTDRGMLGEFRASGYATFLARPVRGETLLRVLHRPGAAGQAAGDLGAIARRRRGRAAPQRGRCRSWSPRTTRSTPCWCAPP